MPAQPTQTPFFTRNQAEDIVRAFEGVRVAVLGDVMLDRYFWGDVERISPEAPVPVVRVTKRSARAGGAANVAANLRELGVDVVLGGVTGKDREADELRMLLEGRGVDCAHVIAEAGRETTAKVRIIARNQQVVRADFETERKPDAVSNRGLVEEFIALAPSCGALVLSDYGKGVLHEPLLGEVIAAWKSAGRPVLVDPHVEHFGWYRGATIATPNAREAARATGIRFGAGVPPIAEVNDAVARAGIDALLVTRGEHGMSLYASGEQTHIPAVAREVYDVTGAGDTVIGVLAAGLATGAKLVDSVVLANAAAGEVVREVGTSALSARDLVSHFDTND